MREAGGLSDLALVRDYGDVAAEAAACRTAAALFDFSFMHRARVAGAGAAALVERISARPVADLTAGRIRYALRIDAAGHVLADLTVWRIADAGFEVFSGRAEDIAALQAEATGTATVEMLTSETAVLAVQGPASLSALDGLAPIDRLRELPYFGHAPLEVAGVPCRVGRLGYTGERGVEIIAPRAAMARLWAVLAERARPAGFAAADILRIEAGFVLFANELRFPVTAAELGLAGFAGPPAASQRRRARLICFTAAADRAPVLFEPADDIGFPPEPGTVVATSACLSALAGGVLGLGFVAHGDREGALVDPSLRLTDIREVGLPFFDPQKRRPRGRFD